MPLTQHELELKNTASERIRRRLLPAEAPKTIWAACESVQPAWTVAVPYSRTARSYFWTAGGLRAMSQSSASRAGDHRNRRMAPHGLGR